MEFIYMHREHYRNTSICTVMLFCRWTYESSAYIIIVLNFLKRVTNFSEEVKPRLMLAPSQNAYGWGRNILSVF
jgi:hypothetical protein